MKTVEKTTALGRVATAIGGPILEEFNQLMADRQQLENILSAVSSTSAPAAALQTRRERSNGSGQKSKRWEDLEPRDQLELIAKALEAKGASNGHWNNGLFREFVTRNFGRYTKSNGRTLRSVLARTSGKFQPNFRKRVVRVLGEVEARVYFERIAKL